jgi:hypothetical protein
LQITINIEKKHLIFLVLLIAIVGGLSLAYNSGGTGGNPATFGHSFAELGPGTVDLGQVGTGGSIPFEIDGTTLSGNDALLRIDDTKNGPGSGDALYVAGLTTIQGKLVVTGSGGNGAALRLYPQAEPFACDVANVGYLYFNSNSGLCFCDSNGGNPIWKKVMDGSAC